MKPGLRLLIVVGIVIFAAAVIYINLSIKNSLKRSRSAAVVNTVVIKKRTGNIVKPVQPRPENKDVEKEPPLSRAPLAY